METLERLWQMEKHKYVVETNSFPLVFESIHRLYQYK